MDSDRFIRNMGFRRVQPHHDPQHMRLGKLGQVKNTRLPADRERIRNLLAPLDGIPRMSTFAIGAIINHCVGSMAEESIYLNVGVWHGYTLLAGMLGHPEKRCVGVDNFSSFGSPASTFINRFNHCRSEQHFFYLMDHEQYFSEYHSGSIGVYLYDGDHRYRNQVDGLRLAEPYFSNDCIILVDDTNWKEPRGATLDFIRGSENVYEILLDQATACNAHPTFWNGIMIFRKLQNPAQVA